MARSNVNVKIALNNIHCHDEGDGWGTAEPYLWTVFFKIDGTTATVTDAATLTGTAFTHFTPGSHGNLNNTDVDAGDDLGIPPALGDFETTIVPIRGGVLDVLGGDVEGVAGVVVVLMEQDNVTDAGAEAGHAALNSAVQSVLDQIVNTRTLTMQDVTDEEIAGFTEQIQDAVEDAVAAQQVWFDNVWSWLNADDTIGTRVFIFKQDAVGQNGIIEFSHRWQNHGDWTISGNITATVMCPANSLDAAFSGAMAMTTLSADGRVESREVIDAGSPRELRIAKEPVAAAVAAEGSVFDLAALREFREGAYQEHPGLARWWALAERNLPSAVYALFRHAELRESAYEVMKELPRVVREPDAPVSESLLENVAALAKGLRGVTRSRKLRIDAGRVLSALELVRGKTFRETAAFLSAVEPSRHPVLDGWVEPSRDAIRIDAARIVGAEPAAAAGARA